MHANPRILLTNDDGIDAEGIKVLERVARHLSDDVWIVAPAANQSGAGHRFTLGHELSAEQRDARTFAVTGTPADCAVVGCTHFAADRKVDIVLSGINHGQNLGDIIHCSGTAAGAREGALQGAIGIALSQAVDYENELPIDFAVSEAHALETIRSILAFATPGDVYFNVNFPFGSADTATGPRVVPHERFSRSLFKHYPSRNGGKFYITIPDPPGRVSEAADFHALTYDRAITVTPLSLRQYDEDAIAELSRHLANS